MKCKRLRDIIEYETGLSLSTNTRRREYVQARGMYYYILRKETNMSLQAISETVKKNHATILHSVNNFDNWLVADSDLSKVYRKVLRSFLSLKDVNELTTTINKGEIIESIMNENELLKEKLLEMNREVDKVRENPLVDLVCEIPEERKGEALERIQLMVQGWSWKYEDKCEIIGGFNSVDSY